MTSGTDSLHQQQNFMVDTLTTNNLTLGGTPVTPTAAELNTLHGITATTAELNNAHVGSRLVAVGATLAVTAALHEGKTLLLDTLAGSVATLPAASGSGGKYRFIVKAKATSNSHKVQVANSSDIMQGIILALSDNTNAELAWIAGAADDTVTLNRTTTGSVAVGEWLEFEDIAANLWAVRGSIAETGTEATPFSSAV